MVSSNLTPSANALAHFLITGLSADQLYNQAFRNPHDPRTRRQNLGLIRASGLEGMARRHSRLRFRNKLR